MPINRKSMKHHPNIYVYDTKRGKRYSVRRKYKGLSGKSHTYTSSGFTSWRDAEQDLKQFEVKLYDGSLASAEAKKITLNAYFEMFADRKQRMGVWKHSTARRINWVYNRHFRKTFGVQNIQDITRISYQRFIDDLVTSNNYTKFSIHQIDSLMQSIMNNAEINDVINKNRLKHITVVGGKPEKNQTLTADQFETIMDTALKELGRYDYALIKIMTLGLRRGELMGLRKSSFKFIHDELHNRNSATVTINLARTPDAKDGTTLKNDSSYRTIFIDDEMADLAKYAIEKSESIMRDFDIDYDNNHFIWLNPATGNPYNVQYANNLLRKITRRTGIKVHPHMLRHYFATKARSQQLPETDIMHWLGHSSVSMTDSYTRETSEGAKRIFDGIKKEL